MKVNRSGFIFIIVFIVFLKSPSSMIGSIVKAEELPIIPDGSYQVELSFLAPEEEGMQEIFFHKLATLKVEQNQYTLFVPILYGNILSVDTVKQQDETIAYSLNKVENLVQFDVKDLQQSISVDGVFQAAEDEVPIHFTIQMKIDVKKLLDSIGEQEKDETEDNEIDKEEPEENEPETDGDDDSTPNPEEDETDSDSDEQPTPPPHEENITETYIKYLLLVDGTNESSIMNTYVNPMMKIVKKDDRYIVQMTILKASWITNLKIEQGKEKLKYETVSLKDNVRVIQFEVKSFSEIIQFWVQVDIPEISYHHQYYVQLKWDEDQLNKFLGENIIHPPVKPTIPKPEMPKTEKPSVEAKKPIQTPREKLENRLQQSDGRTKVSKGSGNSTPEKAEETLSFNRTLDEDKQEVEDEPQMEELSDEEQEIEQTIFELLTLDKMKIAVLIVVCLLSGGLLIRQIKKTKLKKDV